MRRFAAALLIGAGAMIALALAVIVLGLFLVSGSHAEQSASASSLSPEALARTVMALYPNAVIVKMDRQKGEVWVKDKFTGAVICVKLSDLQNPKEPGNDGERSSPAGPKTEAPAQPATPAPPPVRTLPPEPEPAPAVKPNPTLLADNKPHVTIPGWVPRPQGVSVRPAVNSNLDDQASGLFSFETNHAVQELVDFYKKNMREQGLAFLERVSKEGDQAVGAVLNASGNRKLQVQIAREGKVSRVSVAYSKP